MNQKDSAESIVRYPRAEVALVQKFIRKHVGKFTRPSLWERLSDKMTRQTFDHVVGFLLDTGKISVDEEGRIAWIPYPEPAGKGNAESTTPRKAPGRMDDQTRWTMREEANAITCFAFRNGFIEDLHAGKHSELLENPELSRITNAEMKKLMIQASGKVAELLKMKETDPGEYWRLIDRYTETYCKQWEK
jgi:hypothetical protein